MIGLLETNSLAHYKHLLITDVKSFITLGPGLNFIKLFTSIIYECSKKARVFTPGKHFQPSLILWVMSGEYPIVEHQKVV